MTGWRDCRVYWGTHGCCRERGHDGPHECICAVDDPTPEDAGQPPYYGPDTEFYGEDA